MTTLFETTDFEAAHDLLVSSFGKLRLTVHGDRHLLRLRQHDLGPLRLHRNTFDMGLTADGGPLGLLGFGRVIGGSISYRQRNHTHAHTVGELFLALQPDEPYQAALENADIEFALLDPGLLAQVADTAPGRVAQAVRFTGYSPVSPAAARLWTNSHAYVRDNLTGVAAPAVPLLVAQAGRLLAAVALRTFPNNALFDPTIEDRHDAHPVTLRRAVRFIEDNAHRDVSAADIAAAAHVTIRGLQLTFRRHLDTTPLAYLRRVRLEHAHHELLLADPAEVTVGAVAARWGFASHSRFAAQYRAAFGASPSRTLRRR